MFVSPARLSSVAAPWNELNAMLDLAYRQPLTEALFAALETRDYQQRPHTPGWLAARIGISVEDETQTLDAMAAAGVIRWDHKRWHVRPDRRIDTGRVPEEFARLKRHWSKVGDARLHASDDGLFAYSVMSIGQADLERVAALLLQTHHEVRRICAGTPEHERVVLLNIHVCPLDGAPALGSGEQQTIPMAHTGEELQRFNG